MSVLSEVMRDSLRDMVDPRAWVRGLRHPVQALRTVAGDGPTDALLVLFALNAVDELDRTGFAILLPTIRDHFAMSDTGILSLVALTALGAMLLQLPIAILADRGNRVRLARLGGVVWGVFSFATGLSAAVWMLVLVRAGGGIGRAVVDPTHGSLLSDYYPVERRPAVFSFHRGANAVGSFVGPLAAGALSQAFGWRVPFFVFAVPTLLAVVASLRLREPMRGRFERIAAGASAEAVETEEPSASFAEAARMVWKIESLRRLWSAIPLLAVSIIGFVSLAGLLYDRVYGLNDLERGMLAAAVEPCQLLGLVVGGRVGVRLLVEHPSRVFDFLRRAAVASAAWVVLFAWSPWLPLTIVANIGLTSTLAILLPGILATLSLAIPARARAVGFSIGSYWAIPGLAMVPLIGWVSDTFGIRWGMAVMAPVLLAGSLRIATVGSSIDRDLRDVWTGSATRSEALRRFRDGQASQLIVRDLNVSYGSVQILFDVSIEVDRGEVVALLGTNGAGKSTLLRAISGVTEADYGAVVFDGRDITHAPPHEIAALGVGQMPGGKAVFADLTVAENLRAGGWTVRRDRAARDRRVAQALASFPALAERLDEPAGNLSGGQQQMLGLAMNLIAAPSLLLIDELSLGLAPVVVERLVELVREVAAEGTTVILVEQSVNVALTLADRAYFLEKGQVRFSGPTADLLDRPDLLRSVFLGRAVEAATSVTPAPPATGAARTAAAADGAAARGTAAAIPVALEAVGVTCTFGGVRAVDSVDLRVARGEIVGLIGPNGAGKTTLLDALCGYVSIDRGEVCLEGRTITAMSPDARARRGLGRSFQDAALFGSLTVGEALAASLHRHVAVHDVFNPILRMPVSVAAEAWVRSRVDELLDLFALDALADLRVGELSTGSRRIVDLAASVALSPSVLLLDEPSSGIAQREAEALGPLIRRIRDQLGCAVVVVEHDMPLLVGIADRLVAMESGAVVTTGVAAEVLAHPRVVEAYLGATREIIERSGDRGTGEEVVT